VLIFLDWDYFCETQMLSNFFWLFIFNENPVKIFHGFEFSILIFSAFFFSFNFQIVNQKLEIHAAPKIGSLDNIKHKPAGGNIKIFDDKEYLKQIEHPVGPSPPSQVFRVLSYC
jgi:hypothetical protein